MPLQGRQLILNELHQGHQGMVGMKSHARSIVWWPNIDKEIEAMVRKCHDCQKVSTTQPHVSLQAWPWPSRPWSRLHLDFAGPIDNQMILVLIDAHSKWIDAFQMSHAILHLRRVFAQHCIPDTIVTDNESCFISAEFESFMIQNGIKHITSAPYHAATNGLAERAVQIIKRGLKKLRNGAMEERLSKILFQYRITPQSSTQETPAKLLNGRELKSRLDLIKPSIAVKID